MQLVVQRPEKTARGKDRLARSERLVSLPYQRVDVLCCRLCEGESGWRITTSQLPRIDQVCALQRERSNLFASQESICGRFPITSCRIRIETLFTQAMGWVEVLRGAQSEHARQRSPAAPRLLSRQQQIRVDTETETASFANAIITRNVSAKHHLVILHGYLLAGTGSNIF